ncbi:nuclear transport factor 2 family protein [Micromonospora sp. CA-259024]|uniref:nuclear transport factor 2 family protein n=1 Tax=Micromonospora sp. CA-259024 TaxID=3239965 RepID=UPI003D8F5626
MTQNIRSIVDDLYSGLRRMDAPAVVSLFHPEVEIRTPPSLPWSTGHYTGLDGAVAYFTSALDLLDENLFDVEEVRVSGDDWVAAIGQWSGKFKNGGVFDVRFVHFWAIRDGKVYRGEGISDTDGIVRAYESGNVA